MHSRSITHSTCDTTCHIISLLLRLQNYAPTNKIKKNSCTIFILTFQSKSKTKHSNLFKKKEKKKKGKQRKRASTKQKRYNVNPFQPFCGLQGTQNVYLVDGISTANKIDGFHSKFYTFPKLCIIIFNFAFTMEH